MKTKRVLLDGWISLPPERIKKGGIEDWVKPFLAMKNVIVAPAIGRPAGELKSKSVRRPAQALVDFLRGKDLSLAVIPMEVFPWRRKERYPITRGARRGAIPILLGQ